MPDVLQPQKRRPQTRWFRDIDHLRATVKDHDAVEPFAIDWTKELDDGGLEVVLSQTVSASGVSVVSTLFNNRSILNVTGSDGDVTVVATTSSGRELIERLRFIGAPQAGRRAYRRY